MSQSISQAHDARMKATGTVEVFGRGDEATDLLAIRTTSENWVPKKVCGSLPPGKTTYRITHNIGSFDLIVQTRIRNRIREGGISLVDENTVEVSFGGVLNEAMDIVIIG
jgi:hypothetical protein